MYIYILSEKSIYGWVFTVGHYDSNGKFIPESDHADTEKAAERVAYLNGK